MCTFLLLAHKALHASIVYALCYHKAVWYRLSTTIGNSACIFLTPDISAKFW